MDVTAKLMTRKSCAGCHNDFFNQHGWGEHQDDFGTPRCYQFLNAKPVEAYDFPWKTPLPLPIKGEQTVVRPDCYRRPGWFRARPDQLTAEGFYSEQEQQLSVATKQA